MRLEDLKKDMPRTPDFIHEIIREEVERQIKDDKVLHISERKRILHMGKTAAAAVVCALAVSTAVYAGSRLYHMYLEKTGKYSTAVGIKTEEEPEKNSLPEKIHDIEIQADYIPEGMEWSDESHLTYSENPYNGGFTISSVLMDKEDLEAGLVDTGVVESEERVFGKYSGVYLRYQNLTEDASFDQRIYLLCPEEYRVVILYIGDDVSKEEAVKFAENLTVAEKDTMVETGGLYTWSEYVSPEVYDEGEEICKEVEEENLPVYKTGEKFHITALAEDTEGNSFMADPIAVTVDSVQTADDLKLLEGKEIPEEWTKAVDSQGKLVNNHLSYIKSGDGVSTLDQIVKRESVKQKLVYTTVTYTNETDSELDHILYLGNLVLLDHQNGKYRIYDPEEKSGNGYDFVEGDGAAGIGEMRYFSVKEEYGNGGNYISSLKPGESIQIEMAWIVNESDLGDMYLDLQEEGSTYNISEAMKNTGVVYIGQ